MPTSAATDPFTETSQANSTVVVTEDRGTIVQLDPDHPGFRDPAYRARRNAIAAIAGAHQPGDPAPDAPYVPEEHGVWRTVREHLGPVHEQRACAEYLQHAAELDLPRDRIPQLSEVSARLESLTGFRLEPVGGLVHPKVFLSTLADGAFLSTQYIRHHSSPLYTPEPDVVHELIGHACQLASPALCELNRLVGEAALRARTSEALERLGRVYWYTIEFGVLREAGEVRAYGAGLLSSASELDGITTVPLWPFDLDRMQTLDYDVTRHQPGLFCADSMEQLVADLGAWLRTWPPHACQPPM